MQLTVRLFGLEFIHAELCDPEPDADKAPDCTTYPVGFTASPKDQRYAEHEMPELE